MVANNDAELITTVDALLAEQDRLGHHERRIAERRLFECVQLLAPFDGDEMPAQEDFRQVLCRDLSSTGFSFVTYRQPQTDYVVIDLGAVPFKFFVAEIAHTSRAETPNTTNFLVGCRFLRRVES